MVVPAWKDGETFAAAAAAVVPSNFVIPELWRQDPREFRGEMRNR